MLNSTSQVIDQAMSQLREAKVKFVNVSFSIEKIGHSRSIAMSESGRRTRQATIESRDLSGDSQAVVDQPIEWVKVTLSAVPGVNMEDVDDNEPIRKKDHRRVPSTIAMEEVKVRLTHEIVFSSRVIAKYLLYSISTLLFSFLRFAVF
jgi:phosphatidylinositol 4-kinase